MPEGRDVRHPIGAAAVASLGAVRHVCGTEPPECPWHAYSDPEVLAVIDAWRWFDKGQLALRLGNDPPRWLVEGVRVFNAALEAARADVMELESRARKAAHRG